MSKNGLPAGWSKTRVKELFRVVGGGTPDTSRKELWDGDTPWITSADIDEKGRITPRRNVTGLGIAESATNLVPSQSVIVATRVGLGKAGLAPSDMCFSQDCQALLFNPDNLDARFVAALVRAKAWIFKHVGRGTTICGITKKQLEELELDIPPIPEQRRIVAELDKQLSRLDDAVAALRRVQVNCKRYRASVLKAAVEGRLVPTEASLAKAEGRDYEPASELLRRILAERRARWEAGQLAALQEKARKKGLPVPDKLPEAVKRKYQEPAAPDTDDLPELPEGWCWASVEQLITDLKNGLSTVPRAESGSPILRISAVRPMTVDLCDRRFLGRYLPEFDGYELEEGDLLFVRYNGNRELAGVCGVVPQIGDCVLYPDKLIRARTFIDHVMPAYLEAAVNTGPTRAFLGSHVRSTAGQHGISGANIKRAPVPLAPAIEQRRIVESISSSFLSADSASRLATACVTRATRLRQSILKRAFEGKLLPQDSTDEPASKLLERIRSEKAAIAYQRKMRVRSHPNQQGIFE